MLYAKPESEHLELTNIYQAHTMCITLRLTQIKAMRK